MSLQLDYAVPGAALADYVTVFYWFRADVPAFEDIERADHARLRFCLTLGGSTYRFADGANSRSPTRMSPDRQRTPSRCSARG